MTVAKLDAIQDKAGLQTKEKSLFQESMTRFLKNKVSVASLLFIFVLASLAFFGSSLFQDPNEQDLLANNAVPEWMVFLLPTGAELYANFSDQYLLGADSLGRDLLSRTINGARISLSVAFVASSVSLAIGVVYGSISGYLGGRVDNIMMRIVDFLYGFPALIVVILLQATFKALAISSDGESGLLSAVFALNESLGGLLFMFIALGLVNWIGMARIARGQVLAYKKKEFVEAAHALGATDSRILFKHLLPNILGPLIVAETLAIPGYIFAEAFLSFIGLGVDPPTASWGIMISEGIQSLRSYPNQIFVPALLLSITTLAFNFIGDGLRDAFDPRLKE